MIGFTKGMRIRVKSSSREGIGTYVGVIRQVVQSGIVVELENDPALGRNMYNPGGYAQTPEKHQVLRFFYPNEVELVDD